MRIPAALVAGLLASVLAAASSLLARAGEDTSPAGGAWGTSVNATGLGDFDGAKRPRVTLVPQAGQTGLRPASVKVTGFADQVLEMDFSGTLPKLAGPGPATVTVTAGHARVLLTVIP